MKCPNCGSNLNIEDKFCGNCGSPNPFARQHQAEMEHYESEFEATKESVIRTTGAKGKRAGKMTVTAVLVALVCLMLVLLLQVDNIKYYREDRAIAAHRSEYTKVVEGYMADGEYVALDYYIKANRISWHEDYNDYYKVFACTGDYKEVYTGCVMLLQFDYAKYNMESSKEAVIERISKNLYRQYEDTKREKYDRDEYYANGKQEFIDRCKADTLLLIKSVFGLTDEDILAIPTMSEARMNVLLEERFEAKNEK